MISIHNSLLKAKFFESVAPRTKKQEDEIKNNNYLKKVGFCCFLPNKSR